MSASGKRVFTIPPGYSFVDALAEGLLARFPDPLELGSARVLLPTRRACRSLQEAFLRVGAGRPLLLPRMLPLGDLDSDELTVAGEGLEWAAAEAAELPQAIAPLRRQLLLARLVRRGPDSQVSEEQASRLAEELARLLDQVETEGLDFDALETLVPEIFAAHWQQTLRFLEIVTQAWPAILAEEGGIGAAERRRRLLELQAAAWKAKPPEGPVIAAGSTGSIPATAALIQVIAGLPQGSVVLPGLDLAAPRELWPDIGKDPSHPQHGLALLLQRLELEPREVALWPGCSGAESRTARGRLVGAALWPAAATRGWTEAAQDETLRAAAAELPGRVTRLDAETSGQEAAAIALILRQTLETPGKRAALVTPDRDLARRVAAELLRWGIAIDDSAGQPLSRTPPGVFLRLTAALATEALAPLPLLSALKHPLAAGGEAPGAFRRKVRALETLALRGPRPAPGFAGLRQTLKQAREKTGDLEKWLGRLENHAVAFLGALEARENRLQVLIEAHIGFAEALAASDAESGADRLWAGEAGEAAAIFLDELREAARGESLDTASYAGVLSALLAGQTVRPRYGSHPRLAILGPLEARLYHADLMVLGGLNEGTWPAEIEAGPWLSRPMRAEFGLPPLERRIGLAAHDFAQAFAAPEVVLTRARRVGGAPSVPSRWLLRLDAFLAALDASGALKARQPWLAWARDLDRPADRPKPCKRPAPAPPAAARPRRLSVTRVETWMRDPYALYAEQVLRLQRLDDLDAEASAAERGTAIHEALERFVQELPEALPANALERLIAIGEEVFEALKARPSVHAFWWPRFRRAAAWVIEQERARRASGLKVHAETRGQLVLGDFTLTAKADRIETLPGGGLAILDYKTGRAPPKKDLASGLAPQLPLEAAIAAAGGFEGLQTAAAGELAYWRLPGSAATPGEAVEVREKLDDLVAAARDGLAELIRIFDDPATPYHPQPRPGAAAAFNDYEHLARVKEWSAGGGDDT
ncbi:MAG: double-strand break repair protein AddB [Rhodovibrionaceae bacterium]